MTIVNEGELATPVYVEFHILYPSKFIVKIRVSKFRQYINIEALYNLNDVVYRG